MMAVTGAQAQKKAAQPCNDKEEFARSSPNSWKARRQRTVAKKKRQEEKAQEETKEQKEKSIPEGGSVLANKVFEPLKAMLDAYKARLKPNQSNEERYITYPEPKFKTKRLEIFQKMIEGI